MIFSLLVIGLGLLAGHMLHRLWRSERVAASIPLERMMDRMTKTVMLGFNPLILIGAFWIASLDDWRLAALPILGLFSLALGGALAVAAAKLLRLNRQQTGSMFVQGSFTNIGSFGSLFCFMFLGEASLVFVAMFRLLEEFMYYLVGFPVAKMFGEDQRERVGIVPRLKRLARDPFIVVSLAAILIGGGLNVSGWTRPEFYGGLNELLVPLATLMLVISIGFNLQTDGLRGYLRESTAIAAVKYGLVPLATVAVGYAIGLGQIANGDALKAILIVSAMPPAFMSLIPARLYKLDIRLASTSFLVNMILLVPVAALLFWIVT